MAATVDYLETNAMKHERLFHIAPSVEAQEECENMIEQFDAGLDVRLSRCTDPVAVALLFRSYLGTTMSDRSFDWLLVAEQLPEPLLTFERHQAFMSCFVDGQPVEASVLDEVCAWHACACAVVKAPFFVCLAGGCIARRQFCAVEIRVPLLLRSGAAQRAQQNHHCRLCRSVWTNLLSITRQTSDIEKYTSHPFVAFCSPFPV